jgi:5-(carboxyamino)imidazole ribonucleotide synthase
MRNLLGADAEQWPTILADPANHLHLYGKSGQRPDRKMGHVTRVFV